MERMKISILILVVFFLNPLILLAQEVNMASDLYQKQITSSQGGYVQGPLINNEDNKQMGTIGNNVGGQFAPQPSTKLYYQGVKSATPNSMPLNSLLDFFPKIISGDVIKAYKEGMKKEDKNSPYRWGKTTFEDVQKSITLRPTIFCMSDKIMKELWIVPRLWDGHKEHVDYKKMSIVIALSEDTIPFKQDLIMKLLEEYGLNRGANIAVPIFAGDGAEKYLKNEANGFSLFGSWAQIFFSSMSGVTASPSAGYSSGTSSLKAKPFLGIAFLKVDDPEAFYLQSQQAFSQEEKTELVQKCEIIIEILNDELFNTLNKETENKIRFSRGVHHLMLYQETKVKNLIMIAKDDFERIIINNSSDEKMIQDCYFYLSSIWLKRGILQQTRANRDSCWDNSGLCGKKSRMPLYSEPPILKELTLTSPTWRKK